MKNLKFLLLMFVLLMAGFLVSSKTYTNDNNIATVNTLQGLYIFTDSKPNNDYEYLGTVKNVGATTLNPQYTVIRDRIIKKLKKQYPNAEGAIFNFSSGGKDTADAIRFK